MQNAVSEKQMVSVHFGSKNWLLLDPNAKPQTLYTNGFKTFSQVLNLFVYLLVISQLNKMNNEEKRETYK